MSLLKIDNENYAEQINDLYPIEIFVSNKTSMKKLIKRAYKKQSTKQIKLNYNRLKKIRSREIKKGDRFNCL